MNVSLFKNVHHTYDMDPMGMFISSMECGKIWRDKDRYVGRCGDAGRDVETCREIDM